jgi:hypothetical protein
MPNLIVKVGDKNKHLKVPDDWYLVIIGKCKAGDKFANLQTFEWHEVEEDDIGLDNTDFEVLIRENESAVLARSIACPGSK